MITFRIVGFVREAESGLGIGGLWVKAYDRDLVYDDLLGGAATAADGGFDIVSEASDFRDLFERRPDIYLRVYAPDRKTILHSTADAVRWHAARVEEFDVRIPRDRLGPHAPPRGVVIAGDDGAPRTSFDVGEPLALAGSGLSPATVHEVALLDDAGTPLFVQTLMTDLRGVLAQSVLWPQVGLDDPRTGEELGLEDAERRWQGRALTLVLRERGRERPIAEQTVRFPDRFERPVLASTDPAGLVKNGFVAGAQDVILSAHRLPWDGLTRVYLVPRQWAWQAGDSFQPVTLASGRPAVAELEAVAAQPLRARVARAREVVPGAYDFIVRPVRYGYEDAEDFVLRATDLVAHRTIAGLVVREDFMRSKFARGGCVNVQRISGRNLFSRPYFQYTDVFPVGAEVWGALDPSALSPEQQGKMLAFYVVPHKTAAGWDADKSLAHLAALGGNANVIRLRAQTECINANSRLLWPAAGQVGEYDVVADFGNNTAVDADFQPDAQLATGMGSIDVIDGYAVAGFRVVPDPATYVEYANVGTFQYDLGAVVVTDDSGAWDPYTGGAGGTTSVSVARRAVVYFPADGPGASTPAQISAAQASYPIFVAVHGNSGDPNSWLGYNYLLEHLARNGFIAASIHLNPGMAGRGRAEMLFQHLDLLRGTGTYGFGAKAANNIAVMGHSRGGEAVVKAARLIQQNALPHDVRAVVSLAPTDRYGRETLGPPWAKPYLVIYGSMDGDVAGGTATAAPMQTGFSLYDRANGAPKSMVFVYGSTHGRYNTVWGDTDLGFGKLTANDITKLISADAHRTIAKGYMTAFARLHCRGEAQWAGLFQGDWRPPAVEVADAGQVRLFVQYRDTTRRDLDTFEGAHTSTSWQTSTIGAPVDDGNTLPVDPQEAQLHVADQQSPHDSGGLLLRWDGSSDRLAFEVPGGSGDVRPFAALSFRVAQKFGSASNPAGAQDLYVTLTDAAATSRAIRAAKFAEIPEPHFRELTQYNKSAMCTVRIPLHAWTIQVAGAPIVDIANVMRVSFEFGLKPTGELEIDDVEFTN